VEKLAFILPLASCVYLLVSCWWVREFFATPQSSRRVIGGRPPVPAPGSLPDPCPSVSVLKPVRGVDPGAYENFASFCRQDYPHYEILFAVADPKDPAVAVIERLRLDFADSRIGLVTGIEQVVPNPKINSLSAVTREATGEVLVVSDSDMRVASDYLRRVVAPLGDPAVGLVTCCYRGVTPTTFTAKLEALHMGATFLPEVVVARRFLDMHFALGATMALRKHDLEISGGWEKAGAYLAEDNQIAGQIIGLGKRVVLSDYIVDNYLNATTWREQWAREVRWARINRVNRPREYAGIILTFTIPLGLALLPLDPGGPIGLGALAGALVVRWATAWLVTGYTGNRALRRWLPWLPLRDLLSALTWCAGVAGRTVTWRGQRYRLHSDGRLSRIPLIDRAGRIRIALAGLTRLQPGEKLGNERSMP
jgi:ceramide glucosyltransferase